MRTEHSPEADRIGLYDDENRKAGEIEYSTAANGDLLATRTEVSPAFKGRGCAGLLLDALVDYAAASGVKIIPVCSYVVREFEKNPLKYAKVTGALGGEEAL